MTIKGKDVVFLVQEGDGYLPICCARNCSLTTTVDTAETSTVDTGTWKTFKGLRNSFTLSAGGIVSYDMNESIATLRQRQANFEEILFQFYGSDTDLNVERYTGAMIIINISTPSTYNGNLEYSLDAQGTGELTIEILTDTFLVIDFDSSRVKYQ
jgi:predicted secreted protein